MPKALDQAVFDFERVTFDPGAGQEAKKLGMERAALSRKQLLNLARLAAVRVARRQGAVTSDDVFEEMLAEGLDPTALGPACQRSAGVAAARGCADEVQRSSAGYRDRVRKTGTRE